MNTSIQVVSLEPELLPEQLTQVRLVAGSLVEVLERGQQHRDRGAHDRRDLDRGLLARDAWAPQAGWGGYLLRLAGATGLMGFVLFWALPDAAAWLDASVLWRAGVLAGLVLLGAGVYFAALALTGLGPRRLLATLGRS